MSRLPVSSAAEAAGLALRLLGRRRAAFALSAAAFAVAGVAGLVAPWQLGRIVDLVSQAGGGGQGDTRDVVVASLWIGVAALVSAVCTLVSVGALAQTAEPALAELREQVLSRALHLETEELERTGTGDLMSRVSDDVRVVAGSLTDAVPLLVNSTLAIVLTVGGLLALDWRLGVAGLLAAPFYALALRWYLPRSGPYYQREREANGERAEALLTGVHASRTLRALGLGDAQTQQVERASWRSARLSIDVFDLLMRFGGRTNRAEAIGLLLVLSAGFVLVRDHGVTVGAVTAAALYFHRLFNPVGAILFLFDEVQSAGASLTRLAGIALLPDPETGPGTPPRDSGVSLSGVSHEYAPGQSALCGVSLEIAPGERLAVVGASGAGKSTLGLAVAGRLVPTGGTVSIGGVAVRAAGLAERQIVATVSQELHVFAGSVRDNLLLARPDATPEEVDAALATVGAHWVAALGDGADTVVGEGALALTPAQAQQLALARVVLADPWVVVLDEATAEAGSAGARDLEAAALAATRGRTTITIAHRLVQASTADRVLVLEQGRPVELGTHQELLAAGGRYARLWAAWSSLS